MKKFLLLMLVLAGFVISCDDGEPTDPTVYGKFIETIRGRNATVAGFGDIYFTEGGRNLEDKSNDRAFRILEQYEYSDDKALYQRAKWPTEEEYLAFVLESDGKIYMINSESGSPNWESGAKTEVIFVD